MARAIRLVPFDDPFSLLLRSSGLLGCRDLLGRCGGLLRFGSLWLGRSRLLRGLGRLLLRCCCRCLLHDLLRSPALAAAGFGFLAAVAAFGFLAAAPPSAFFATFFFFSPAAFFVAGFFFCLQQRPTFSSARRPSSSSPPLASSPRPTV